MTSQKLQNVFNEYGDKLIELHEVAVLEMQELKAHLSSTEIATVFMAATTPERLAIRTAEVAAGGTYLQSSDGRVFTTTEAYQKLEEKIEAALPGAVPKEIEERAEDATAEAIRKATDYSGQRQSLGLKPLF